MTGHATPTTLYNRLVNWALYVRSPRVQGVSATGAFCDQLARQAGQGGYAESKPGKTVDDADGQRVEEAWRKCETAHKELLKWFYVRNAPPGVICRNLAIPHRPKHVFEERRHRAENEIARYLADVDRAALAQRGQAVTS